ncbi:MAG TPA: glycosyltransferase family 2 protein [Aggregatilineales bacterium]|nr:glycosyltransferase family 2 protein [Aggregatilineales bacterium]
MRDLAVILVSWNTRDLILDALRSLSADLASSRLDAEIWVVDNASMDGSPDAIRAEFPMVKLLAQPDNLGFAGGNNLALRALGFHDSPTPNPAGPRAVFLLNSDTRVEPGAVRILHDALFSLPHAGLVGAQLAYEDGSFQHGAFRFPGLTQIVIDLYPLPKRLLGRLYESRLNGRYPRAWSTRGDPFPVDFTLGATMLLRREAIEATGLFDEQFFMYCEEIDWAARIRQAGWAVYTVPGSHITHLAGRSTAQIRPQSLVNLWSSRYRLYRKHYAPPRFWIARHLVRIGMTLQIRQMERTGNDTSSARIEAYRRIIALFTAGAS